MGTKVKIDDIFWTKFAKRYWEKKPTVIKNAMSDTAEIDAQHLMDLLVRYSDHCRELKSTDGIKLYIDGRRQFPETVLKYLPRKSDKTLHGYNSRMSSLFADYCLVCDELILVGHAKFDVMRRFVQGLYKEVGLPNRFAETGLYLGNYRKTPFGVHVDPCGVFSFPVVGKKAFRLWPSSVVKKNPGLAASHKYKKFSNLSSLLVAEPNDISYWPSSYWHIAESDGCFSATWSIGIWVDRPFSELVIEKLTPLIEKKLLAKSSATSVKMEGSFKVDGQMSRMPDLYSQASSALRQISRAELSDLFIKTCLKSNSEAGFKMMPLLKPRPKLTSSHTLGTKPGSPLLWAKLSDGTLCIGAQGVLIGCRYSKETVATLRALNLGKPYSLKRRSPATLHLLERIYQARGIDKFELKNR